MNDEAAANSPAQDGTLRRGASSKTRIATQVALYVALIYFTVAYIVLPAIWSRYIGYHPAIDNTPTVTITGDKHPGDPINVGLVGSEENLRAAFQSAGWFPAQGLGVRSDIKIAADTVLERPYNEAPVSNLFLFGRKEDVAFELPVGGSPGHRHHVRFWKSAELDAQERPLWVGSASYDKRVGLSHTTGQITHHIDSQVDKERDFDFEQLKPTGFVTNVQYIDNFHTALKGFNGGGDEWLTDGRLLVGTLGKPK